MKPSKKKIIKKKKEEEDSLSHLSPPAAALGGDNNGSGAVVLKEEEEKERDLDWLTEAFASASIDQIASAYHEAGGDAYKVAGILASHLEDPGPGPMDLGSSPAGVVEVKEAGKGNRRGSRRRIVSAASGMVSNVIGKSYTNQGKRRNDVSLSVEEEEAGMMPGTYSVEEVEEFLCSMLGNDSKLGMGVVKDVLGQCGCDIEKALDALLDMTVSSFSSLNGGTFKYNDRIRRNNSGICTEISSKDFSKNIITSYQLADDTLRPTCHLPENVNELPPDMGYSTKGQLLPRPDQTEPNLKQKVLESLFNASDHQTYEPNLMDWEKVVKKIKSFKQGLEFSASRSSDTQPDISDGRKDLYEEFRSDSRHNWDAMRRYYKKAAIEYSKGQKAYASYLSEKGKYYCYLARETDEKASRDIFEARNREIKNTVEIDLHGQHVKQAIGLVKRHILLFSYIPSVKFLKVITGCGSDSVGNGKLKRSVLALAEKEGIKYVEENVGTLILRFDRDKVYSFVESDHDP